MRIIRAPAKVILFGEHSIVYPGHIAVLCAIGLYVYVQIKKNNSSNNINFTFLNKNKVSLLKFEISKAKNIYKSALTLREEYLRTNHFDELSDLMSNNFGAYFVLIGRISCDIELSGLDITVNIQIPIGSGMGSSAAINSSIIKAIYNEYDLKINKEKLFDLTKELEDFQHGRSSGADPAIVINGGFLSYHHCLDGSKEFDKIYPNMKDLKDLFLINTGRPTETTGEMVSFVSQRYIRNPEKYKKYFKKINYIADCFINNPGSIDGQINENGMILERIGVVSDLGMKISKEIRQAKGSIKVIGAGGRKGRSSGIMLCKFEDKDKLRSLANKYKCEIIIPKFGVGIK